MFGRAPGLSNGTDLSKLKADGDSKPEAIRQVAEQFESIFLHQVFKSMRATVPKDGMTGGGFGGEVFTDMLDQQYANIASSSSSFGLAESIARQLGAGEAESGFQLREPQGLRRMNANKAYKHQAHDTQWTLPVDGELSGTFGAQRSHMSKVTKLHRGIDWNAPSGTAIRAAKAGTVTYASDMGKNGQTVVLDHGNGIESLYAHASGIAVNIGDKVKAGEEIARVGSSGNADREHLHFEVRQNGKSVDPASLLGLKKK
jgi:murein DD-endopeptidase MepM/ murein hydrolase activator NlpD